MAPKFIVIAGPNGAGKSITSQKILAPFKIEAFDWDKQFQSKWKSFDFDPTVVEGIRDSVNAEFQDHIRSAFSDNMSVAYETNFHSSYNLELANDARKKGYETNLYFLALVNPEIGISRVAERVRSGGHDVSEATIRERFRLGLEFLDTQAVEYYDKIFVYNSSVNFERLIVIENQRLLFKSDLFNNSIWSSAL
ncbi:MAG: hypothetical protein RIC06_25675 [Cyclobacteriaceae bacterium]